MATYPRTVSILGAGPIGRALGRHWIRAGHAVTFGVRSPEKLRDVTVELGPRARATTLAEAAGASDVVVIAVLYSAVDEVISSVRDELVGKIVISASNPMGISPEGRIVSTLEPGVTEGTHLAGALGGSTVVRAFTHVMNESLAFRGSAQPHLWAMAVAGDDETAKQTVAGLVRDTGFTPVDVGSLAASAPLDPGGMLFPHMFTEADMRVALAAGGDQPERSACRAR